MTRGFTLIEVMVALVLFEFGMLALAAATAVAARDLGDAQRRLRARTLARHRVELLRAAACPAPTVGAAPAEGGLLEFWRVEAVGRVRVITDSVDWARPGARRGSLVLRAWTICAP